MFKTCFSLLFWSMLLYLSPALFLLMLVFGFAICEDDSTEYEY